MLQRFLRLCQKLSIQLATCLQGFLCVCHSRLMQHPLEPSLCRRYCSFKRFNAWNQTCQFFLCQKSHVSFAKSTPFAARNNCAVTPPVKHVVCDAVAQNVLADFQAIVSFCSTHNVNAWFLRFLQCFAEGFQFAFHDASSSRWQHSGEANHARHVHGELRQKRR